MSKTKRTILTLLALIGLGLAIELCFVYYNANFAVNAKPSICAINDMMDCDGVARTSFSQFFGIPLSLWGVFLYLFFLFMTYVDKIQNIKFLSFLKVFKNPRAYIFTIALLSFAVSMILGCISIFKINSICIFCFMTYFVDLLIAITAKTKGISILQDIKTTITDFTDAIKQKAYGIAFIILATIGIAVLTYTTTTNVLSPQIAHRNAMRAEFKNYKNMTEGNEIGAKDADIVINEYMDYNCGGCFIMHATLLRIVNEFENVKVIQHQLPLEKTCNHNMQHDGHKNSCLKSSYALAAKKQNKYWEMSDILFFEAPETEKEIIEQARLADFDIKKLKEDANSEEIKQEIHEAVEDGDKNEINGTPTIFIGMKRFVGSRPYNEFKQMIIDMGGREKQQANEQ